MLVVMNADLNTVVSAELRAEMARQGISQEDLGSRIGMGQVPLSRRLTGKVGWRVGEVAAAAAALGVPTRQLIPDLIAS